MDRYLRVPLLEAFLSTRPTPLGPSDRDGPFFGYNGV